MTAYNDGVVRVYAVAAGDADGSMPSRTLNANAKAVLRYKERTVGLGRYYAALQANVRVQYVLRVPKLRSVSTQDIAIPNDGEQYRIVQIQYPEDDKLSMDLTLEEVQAAYDLQ